MTKAQHITSTGRITNVEIVSNNYPVIVVRKSNGSEYTINNTNMTVVAYELCTIIQE